MTENNKEEIKEDSADILLNKSRLNKLIEIEDIEEFYYLINILDEPKTKELLEHYKKNNEDVKNKISKIIQSSNSKAELVKNLEREIVVHLKERFDQIASKIVEERKKGKDVYYEWVKSMSVPLKIRLYEATLQKKDFYKIKKLLDDIETELKKIR